MSSSRLAYLDGWRGLAIIGLLIGHFFPVPGINLGRVGVDLFFVLSGLLMGRLLFLDQVALPTFFKRRVSRILPATLVFVAVVCLAHWANGAPISWFELSTALLFVKNYWPESVTLPFGHIWSLSVEEHSYLFLAALAFVVRSRRWPALLLLGSAVIFSVGATFVLNATEPGRTAAYDWRLRTETAAYGILVSAWLQVWFAQRGGPPRLLAHAAPLALVVGVLGSAVYASRVSTASRDAVQEVFSAETTSPPLAGRFPKLPPASSFPCSGIPMPGSAIPRSVC